MSTKPLAQVAVTYLDGSVDIFTGENMRHVEHRAYPKGSKKVEDGYQSHQIRWNEKPKET